MEIYFNQRVVFFFFFFEGGGVVLCKTEMKDLFRWIKRVCAQVPPPLAV